MVERLFLVPRLGSPSWHLCLKVSKVYGSDVRGIPGGPEDGRESVPRHLLVSPAWHLCLKVSRVCGSDLQGFLEAQRMVERLFLVPCLVSRAWHLCLKVSKVYGSDIRGIPGGPEDGREAVPCPPSGQPCLAPLPQGE
jgi:hypothetical protein